MKKYILWLFVIIWCIFNFSNAWYVFKFNNTYAWPFDANYDINVFWKWIPLTSSLWYSKKMLYITNGRYMFWQENQLPYIYSNGIYWQINFYKICPNLWWEGNPFWTTTCNSYPCSINYWQNNCSQTNITNAEETKNIIWSFFSTLNQSTDYYYIHYVNNLTMFCFYSSSLDKIICFFQPSSSNWTNYWSSFDWISSNLLYNPPSYSPTWWENEWWNNNWNTNTWNSFNTNNYYCPTFKQVLNNFWNNYNTWLCYNSTKYYDNNTNQFETITQDDIFTIFTNYEEYTNRINIYRNYCTTPATPTACNNAFSGEFKKYSIISKAINNKVDEKKLWNYCNIWLNYDLNATTCVASWYIAEQPTTEELMQEILNWNTIKITELNTPASWTILNTLLSWWERNDVATRDILWQIQQIEDKIWILFDTRSWVSGIIPDYILWLILLILLFTVLLKK